MGLLRLLEFERKSSGEERAEQTKNSRNLPKHLLTIWLNIRMHQHRVRLQET